MEILELSTPVIATAGATGATLVTTAVVFGIRKLIQIGQYSYHNSRLSTIGNPYIRRDEVLPLIESANPSSLAKSIVSDIAPGEDLDSFRDVDRSLIRSFHTVMTDLVGQTPAAAKPLVNAFISHLEAEELKRLLRLIGYRKESLFPVGWLNADLERNILSSKDIPAALEVLEGQPVASRIANIVSNANGIDLSAIDLAIDRFVLDNLRKIDGLSSGARKGSRAFFDIFCDRYNIHLILRSKINGVDRDTILSEIYISGGIIGLPQLEQMIDATSTREAIHSLSGSHLENFFKDVDPDDMTGIETALEKMMLEGSIGLSHSFGSNVGPTIRYMVSKELELRNLRTLFQGSFSEWEADRTRRLLVLEEGS